MVIAEMRNCVVSPEMGKDVVFNGTFQVRAGERVAVVGPNGSGKTTLLMLLSGLNRPSSGQVQVFGSRPNIRSEAFRSRIGLLMQHPDDQLLAPTVFHDVSLTLRAQGWATTDIKIRTDEVLSQLGIEHLRERPPHHLSGGEKKMVALAGALVHKPELLLLDEPFAGLDGFAVVAMIKTLAEYNSRLQGSIVISSHDLEGLSEWADKAYVVSQGALSEPYGIERVLAERRALDLKSQGYPDIPAVYSRLLVESLRNKCYNAGEVMN